MKLMTACFVAIMGASAWGQLASPAKTINNVRNQLHAVSAQTQQREKAVQQHSSASAEGSRSQKAASRADVRKNQDKPQPSAASRAPEDGNSVRATGKRDPFVSVIRSEPAQSVGCATGKRCLVVGDIALKGVVRSPAGMIAVVENGQRKTYFLHENDPVFNGQVVKIEPDAIVFRETVVDRAGHESSREVVKRISKPAIS
jgi:hypothetical protein